MYYNSNDCNDVIIIWKPYIRKLTDIRGGPAFTVRFVHTTIAPDAHTFLPLR